MRPMQLIHRQKRRLKGAAVAEDSEGREADLEAQKPRVPKLPVRPVGTVPGVCLNL